MTLDFHTAVKTFHETHKPTPAMRTTFRWAMLGVIAVDLAFFGRSMADVAFLLLAVVHLD